MLSWVDTEGPLLFANGTRDILTITRRGGITYGQRGKGGEKVAATIGEKEE